MATLIEQLGLLGKRMTVNLEGMHQKLTCTNFLFFSPRTIIDWNGLDQDTVHSATIDVFKNKIRSVYD